MRLVHCSWLLSLASAVDRFDAYSRIVFGTIPSYQENNPEIIGEELYSSIRTEGDFFIPTVTLKQECDGIRKKKAVLVTCGVSARDWLSVTHCLNLIEELIENPTCNTDWFIMPLVNPEGYDYSYNSDRAWIKNRQDNGNSFCPGININANFDFMFDTDDSNTCGDDYPGPSPDSAEVRAIMQFANEINSHKKEYEQRIHISMNGNGNKISIPWKGSIGSDFVQDQVPNEFFYWHYKQADRIATSVSENSLTYSYAPNTDPVLTTRGSILDYFGENFTFSFELSSINGPNTDWLNTENQIATFDQVWNEIESLIAEIDVQSVGTVTAYPIIESSGNLTIAFREHSQNIDVRFIDDMGSSTSEIGQWSDERGPFDGQSRWSATVDDTAQKRLLLGDVDSNNCIRIEYGFDQEALYKVEAVENCIQFIESHDENSGSDYWWGGASLIYMDGGLTDNRDSLAYPFEPKDTFGNWGGLLEPYWIGTNENGATSVRVNNSDPIPLVVGITSEENNDFNRQLCLSSNYIRSEFNRRNSQKLKSLEYEICFQDNAADLQKDFLAKINRPDDLPDRSMIYDPIFSTWAIYKQSIDEEKLREFFNQIKSNGYNASNIEVDDGYEIGYGDHSFDPAKFPNINDLIDEIHDFGANVTLWVTPFINPESYEFEEVLDMECFVVGERRGFENETVMVKWWDGEGGMVDFTKPECTKWFVDHLNKRKTDYSVDGFKFDAGEVNYLLDNFKTGGNILRPVDWTIAYDDMIEYNMGGISEVRSAWANQKSTYWMRMFDKGSHWSPVNGLQTMVPHLILSSLLGYQYILPDMVGGNVYDSGFNGTYVPDKELFIRWLEVSAFMPSIQYSISPWQYEDDEVSTICMYWTKFHNNIIAPIYEDIFERYVAGEDVIPIMPIAFAVTNRELKKNPRIRHITQQFIIDEQYLVAPVVFEDKTSIDEIYFPYPESCWQNYFDENEIVQGGTFLNEVQVLLEEVSFWMKIDC